MNLKHYGEQLTALRKRAGQTQRNLADHLGVAEDLVSKWSRGYEYKNRTWIPSRESALKLIELFAGLLTVEQARGWALLAGHEFTPAELAVFFPDQQPVSSIPFEPPPLPEHFVPREALARTILIGLEQGSALALVGAGGLGKSVLASWLAHRQQALWPDGVIWLACQPGDTVADLQARLAAKFQVQLTAVNPADRGGELRTLLSGKQCMLVIDDLWNTVDLAQLRVVNAHSLWLVTTRDRKVADILGLPLAQIGPLTTSEGKALLVRWGGQTTTEADDNKVESLVNRLGGHALALELSGAQLRAGYSSLAELEAYFKAAKVDLSVLDTDEPQSRQESLEICFELSYRGLTVTDQQHFAQTGYFVDTSPSAALAAVWGLDQAESRRVLRRMQRFALLEGGEEGYRQHTLIKAYARAKLQEQPAIEQETRRRHALWFIRHRLYHPGVLGNVGTDTPELGGSWLDIIQAVSWAAVNAPALAAKSALLAYTERPALLEAVGRPLLQAVETYLAGHAPGPEQAVWCELLADLYLLRGDFAGGRQYFEQAGAIWQDYGQWLLASQCQLRIAGTYLLEQEQPAAAKSARKAQQYLRLGLPLRPETERPAYWLFYWFDVVYFGLTRWADLPEADVANLAGLAVQTEDMTVRARGVHIYCRWCTASERFIAPEIRRKGIALAIEACKLWRASHRPDRADEAISWSGYLLNGRYSQRAARRYARRRSQTTPQVSADQIRLVKNLAVRWWLGATESQRIAWMSRMYPRYLGADNAPGRPLRKGSLAWQWVDNIIKLGALGVQGRRLMNQSNPQTNHILGGAEWQAFSGQMAFPLVGRVQEKLIGQILTDFEK